MGSNDVLWRCAIEIFLSHRLTHSWDKKTVEIAVALVPERMQSDIVACIPRMRFQSEARGAEFEVGWESLLDCRQLKLECFQVTFT